MVECRALEAEQVRGRLRKEVQSHVDKAVDAPYPMLLRPLQEDEGGGWLAEIPDLPGCMSDGDTPEEAVHNVLSAQEAWLTVQRERGRGVPRPTVVSGDCSGELTLRLPRSLHRQLSLRARMEGVTLNELVLYLISRALGLGAAKVALGKANKE